MKIYDPDIRKLLYSEFGKVEEFICDPETKIVNEMDVCYGASRIDVAVINGRIHGYEIKSERDSLERLPSQIDAYNKVFDTITVVVGENHISNVEKTVPSWWGILYVDKNNKTVTLKRKRRPEINNNVDIFHLTQFLWKDELVHLLDLNGFEKSARNKTRLSLCKFASENIKACIVKDFVKTALKSRKTWRAVPLQQLYDDLPQ